MGTKIPDVTRTVNWVFIHYDLITQQENDVESDVLYSLSTVRCNVSYPFKEERLEFHPVDKSRVDSIWIRITDGRNNPLDLNEPDVAFSLMIEET